MTQEQWQRLAEEQCHACGGRVVDVQVHPIKSLDDGWVHYRTNRDSLCDVVCEAQKIHNEIEEITKLRSNMTESELLQEQLDSVRDDIYAIQRKLSELVEQIEAIYVGLAKQIP